MATLNKKQHEAVEKNQTSLLIVAGAGTGKTRVLVEKMKHLIATGTSPQNILALTFTNKAADEMRERVIAANQRSPYIGTFHSWCAVTLREFHEAAAVDARFTIADRDVSKRIITRVMKSENVVDVSPAVMQSRISSVKMERGKRGRGNPLKETLRTLERYNSELEAEKLLDFDDLIVKTIHLLEHDHEVRKTLQNRYRYILVDEFQDTDVLQNKIISLLKSPETYIIAVGDTDQTIYSWRGASVHNMLSFTETYSPSTVVTLTENYRSTGNILSAANAVISKNRMRHDKEITPTRGDGANLSLAVGRDEDDEARLVAENVIALHESGVRYDSIAVLFRANFQARAFESAFLTRAIPYTVLGARFFDRAEVKNLLAYLTLIVQPSSREAFERASSVPRRGIGVTTINQLFNSGRDSLTPAAKRKVAEFEEVLIELRTASLRLTLSDLLTEIVRIIDYPTYLAQTFDNPADRLREVRELIAFSQRFGGTPCTEAIHGLLETVALGSDQDSLRTDKSGGVRLMTVHAAKGLEFSHVFIVGLENGLFPFSRDEFEEHDAEEERRLCYVAMTRAKDKLFCTYAQRRGYFGSYTDTKVSPFIEDIPTNLLDIDGEERREDIEW